MNRRQFLGAQLAAGIASACLPLGRFMEWLRGIFQVAKPWPAFSETTYLGVDRATMTVFQGLGAWVPASMDDAPFFGVAR